MSVRRCVGEPRFPRQGALGVSAGACVSPQVSDAESTVSVEFTPTIPHCSMATLIGLSIKVKLLRSLPDRFKVSSPVTGQSRRGGLCMEKLLKRKKNIES